MPTVMLIELLYKVYNIRINMHQREQPYYVAAGFSFVKIGAMSNQVWPPARKQHSWWSKGRTASPMQPKFLLLALPFSFPQTEHSPRSLTSSGSSALLDSAYTSEAPLCASSSVNNRSTPSGVGSLSMLRAALLLPRRPRPHLHLIYRSKIPLH